MCAAISFCSYEAQEQYDLLFSRHLAFPVLRAVDDHTEVVLPTELEDSKTNYLRKYTRTMVWDVPPNGWDFDVKHSSSLCLGSQAGTSSTLNKLDGSHSLALDSLTIRISLQYSGSLRGVTRLVSPCHFHVVSQDDTAGSWLGGSLIREDWSRLESLQLENCFLIFEGQSGGIDDLSVLPFRYCPNLRSINVVITKWDGERSAPDTHLSQQLFRVMPVLRDWPSSTVLEIGITGRGRFEALQVDFESFKNNPPNLHSSLQKESWNQHIRLVLLPGDVGPEPHWEYHRYDYYDLS